MTPEEKTERLKQFRQELGDIEHNVTDEVYTLHNIKKGCVCLSKRSNRFLLA